MTVPIWLDSEGATLCADCAADLRAAGGRTRRSEAPAGERECAYCLVRLVAPETGDTVTGPCCGTCKWFNGPNNAGHCRRHAPPWPGVIDSDYCGEYSVARWYEVRSDRLASEASAPSRRDEE